MIKSINNKKNILLFFAFFIYSGITVCAKFASQQLMFSAAFLVFVFIEIICLGVYAILWQQVLKYFSLTTAILCKGSVVIISFIWAVIIFKENVTPWNLLGAVFIILGIWLVSKDD